MPNPELASEVKKLRSDIETLKSLVFSNDNRFKTHAVDLIFLKSNVVNKGNAKNPVKFLREDRTWATVENGNLFPRRPSAPDPISGSAQGWWSTVAGAPMLTLASEDGGGTLRFVVTDQLE